LTFGLFIPLLSQSPQSFGEKYKSKLYSPPRQGGISATFRLGSRQALQQSVTQRTAWCYLFKNFQDITSFIIFFVRPKANDAKEKAPFARSRSEACRAYDKPWCEV